jgi:hypothetical protein
LQDFDHACLTKEARAQNDLARPIKEARAPDVETDSKNTIIVHIPEGSLIKGKSCTICIDFTSCIDLITLRRKDRIKARKVDRAESRD